MPTLKFDIDVNTSQFGQKVKDITVNLNEVARVMKSVGQNFDISSTEAQIKSLKQIISDSNASIRESTKQLNQWGQQAKEAFSKGDFETYAVIAKDMQKLASHIEETTKETELYKNALSEVQKMNGFGNEQADAMENMRTKMRNLIQEVSNYTLQYRMMTDAEKKSESGQELNRKIQGLKMEAGQLRDVMADVNKEIGAFASDTGNFDALSQAVDTVVSGFGAFEGVVSTLGIDEKDLMEIQTQLQASLAVSNALKTIQNNLQKESAMMVKVSTIQTWALAKAEAYERLIKMKGTEATIAATVAQKAFNLVAKANPYVLLATALLTVVGAIAGFVAWNKKSKKEQEEAAKATAKHNEELKKLAERQNELNKASGTAAAGFAKLSIEWRNLKNNAERTKWIENNKSSFEALGLSVSKITTAERIFNDDTGAVCKAILARAVAMKQAEQAAEKIVDINRRRNERSVKNGDYYARYGEKNGNTMDATWGYNSAEDAKLWQEAGLIFGVDYGDNNGKAIENFDQLVRTIAGGAKLNDKGLKKLNDYLRTKATERRKSYDEALDKETKAAEKEYEEAYQKAIGSEKILSGFSDGKPSNDSGTKEQDKTAEVEKRQSKEREKAIRDARLRMDKLEAEGWTESLKKSLRLIELTAREERNAVDDWYDGIKEEKIKKQKELFDADPNNKDKTFVADETKLGYTDQEVAERAARLLAITKKSESSVKEIYDNERRQMREFLIEYGTYQQQKLAITEQYTDLITKAREKGDEVEAQRLIKERDAKTANVSANEMRENINWAAAFSGTQQMKDVVTATLQEIEKYMQTDQFKGLDAENQKSIIEGRDNLVAQLGGGGFGSELQKMRDANESLTNAMDDYKTKLDNLKKASEDVNDAMVDLSNKQKDGTEEEIRAAEENLQTAIKVQQAAQEEVDGTKVVIVTAQRVIAESSEKFQSNMNSVVSGLKQMGSAKDLSGIWGGLSDTLKGLSGGKMDFNATDGLGKAGGYIGAAVSLADMINEQGLSSIIDNLSDTISGAVTGIMESIVSGDLFVSLGKSIANSFMAPFDAIFGNGNMKALQDEIDDLTESNENLKEAMADLEEALKDSNTQNALTAYDKLMDNFSKQVSNMRTIMSDYAKMWERGSHSLSAEFNKDVLGQVNRTLGTNYASLSDFLSRATEEQAKLLREDTATWTAFKSELIDNNSDNNGNADAIIEMMGNLADLAGKAEEYTDQLNEKFLGITFDSMRDNWRSALRDMTKSTSDFAADVENIVNNALIDAVADGYEKELNDVYDGMAKAAQQKNYEALAYYKDQYVELTKRAQTEIKTLEDMGYISTEASASASATSNAVQSITAEQGNEISGRLTAVQISNQGILNGITQVVTQNTEQVSVLTEQSAMLGDIQLQLATTNTYLEDIEKHTKKLESISSLVESIKTNSDRL